jgi:flagella basal body P-ring formation protein FlgA
MATSYDKSVMISSSDLRKGHVLRADDLYIAHLASDENFFTPQAQLEGLILGQNVSRGQVLRLEQVLRLQTIAIEEIPPGMIITDASVALVWSPYRANALLNVNDAIGHKSLGTLRKGEVILKEFVDPNLSEQRKSKE